MFIQNYFYIIILFFKFWESSIISVDIQMI